MRSAFFNDDSILNLSELSRVEVEEYMYNAEKNRTKSIYKLVEGSLRVVVGRSDLEVHTSTAVAASRGTKFVIWTENINEFTGNKIFDSNNLLASSSNTAGDYIFAERVKSTDKYKPSARTCIYVLSGKVSLKSMVA